MNFFLPKIIQILIPKNLIKTIEYKCAAIKFSFGGLEPDLEILANPDIRTPCIEHHMEFTEARSRGV